MKLLDTKKTQQSYSSPLALVLGLVAFFCLAGAAFAQDTPQDRLQAVVLEQAGKLQQLEAQLQAQNSRQTRQDAVLEAVRTGLEHLNRSLAEANNHAGVPSTAAPAQKPMVAFEAQYRSDPAHNINDHDIMLFDDVKINLGGGYNVSNGAFQVPVTGLYVLHMKVTLSPYGHIYAYLLINGQHADSVDATQAQHQATGTSLKIVHLRQGDRVQVMKQEGVTSVRGWVHTKFSGFLLSS